MNRSELHPFEPLTDATPEARIAHAIEYAAHQLYRANEHLAKLNEKMAELQRLTARIGVATLDR